MYVNFAWTGKGKTNDPYSTPPSFAGMGRTEHKTHYPIAHQRMHLLKLVFHRRLWYAIRTLSVNVPMGWTLLKVSPLFSNLVHHLEPWKKSVHFQDQPDTITGILSEGWETTHIDYLAEFCYYKRCGGRWAGGHCSPYFHNSKKGVQKIILHFHIQLKSKLNIQVNRQIGINIPIKQITNKQTKEIKVLNSNC